MTKRHSPWLDSEIADYVAARTAQPDPVVSDLIAETAAATGELQRMQIAADQASLMGLLVGLVAPALAVEVGSFTGLSGLSIARALPPGGRLICCDVSEEWTSIGRRAWARAGVADRIELRLGPAVDTLRAMPTERHIGFAFIDADKASYGAYYDELLPRMVPNGLITIDNTLWSGNVLPGRGDDADTVALRALNDRIAADDRVESYILPVADGLTLIRVR